MGKETHKRDNKGERVRSHEHSRHLEREGNTRKGDTGEGETSILMTHNSLYCIMVTDATFHELRGWLKALALSNTVHQYKGKKHTKETRGRE